MKFGKRIISGFLALIMLCSLPIYASASEKTVISVFEQAELSVALQGIEVQKERWGLDNVDFSDLRVSEPVSAYNYIDGTFEVAHSLYPILFNGKLILFAIKSGDKFQITTGLVEEINQVVDADDCFSIVYYDSSTYVYNGNEFICLQFDDDSSLVVNFDIEDNDSNTDLKLSSLNNNGDLTYTPSLAREQIYYECDVDYVPQSIYSICWAAVVACIANYKNNTSLTSYNVAIDYYGEANYNQGLNTKYIPNALSNYGISYVYQNAVPSDGVILNNIQQDYPIYGGWLAPSGDRHATCIYGINAIGGYIYIMDPQSGFVSVPYSSGGYSYVSSTGHTFTLDRAVCKTWSVE